MAQQLTIRENVQRKPTAAIMEPKIADWDSFLLDWLQKIALNPQFYDDAKTKLWFWMPLLRSHGLGNERNEPQVH